jgi:hypothetical protein
MKATLLATALALCAASVSAQTIYISVSLDGHKTFSDRAQTTQEPVPEEVAARRTPAGTMARGSRGAMLVNANEAERRLTQAQRKRSKGMALESGESDRIPGGIVVNSRYWNRQKVLDLEVEQAQRRSNETQKVQLAQQ